MKQRALIVVDVARVMVVVRVCVPRLPVLYSKGRQQTALIVVGVAHVMVVVEDVAHATVAVAARISSNLSDCWSKCSCRLYLRTHYLDPK
ncbi:hypothetical protein D5086_022383 [Populus alba]|uniref:Uncharacterized protein n=1 Tax=Populus alba TaxID=43335 RepID=A0ACC4BEU6_POPAL